jgi:hypothetical protein
MATLLLMPTLLLSWLPQSEADGVERKAHHDAQLAKANADAVGMKAAFDKASSAGHFAGSLHCAVT